MNSFNNNDIQSYPTRSEALNQLTSLGADKQLNSHYKVSELIERKDLIGEIRGEHYLSDLELARTINSEQPYDALETIQKRRGKSLGEFTTNQLKQELAKLIDMRTGGNMHRKAVESKSVFLGERAMQYADKDNLRVESYDNVNAATEMVEISGQPKALKAKNNEDERVEVDLIVGGLRFAAGSSVSEVVPQRQVKRSSELTEKPQFIDQDTTGIPEMVATVADPNKVIEIFDYNKMPEAPRNVISVESKELKPVAKNSEVAVAKKAESAPIARPVEEAKRVEKIQITDAARPLIEKAPEVTKTPIVKRNTEITKKEKAPKLTKNNAVINALTAADAVIAKQNETTAEIIEVPIIKAKNETPASNEVNLENDFKKLFKNTPIDVTKIDEELEAVFNKFDESGKLERELKAINSAKSNDLDELSLISRFKKSRETRKLLKARISEKKKLEKLETKAKKQTAKIEAQDAKANALAEKQALKNNAKNKISETRGIKKADKQLRKNDRISEKLQAKEAAKLARKALKYSKKYRNEETKFVEPKVLKEEKEFKGNTKNRQIIALGAVAASILGFIAIASSNKKNADRSAVASRVEKDDVETTMRTAVSVSVIANETKQAPATTPKPEVTTTVVETTTSSQTTTSRETTTSTAHINVVKASNPNVPSDAKVVYGPALVVKTEISKENIIFDQKDLRLEKLIKNNGFEKNAGQIVVSVISKAMKDPEFKAKLAENGVFVSAKSSGYRAPGLKGAYNISAKPSQFNIDEAIKFINLVNTVK